VSEARCSAEREDPISAFERHGVAQRNVAYCQSDANPATWLVCHPLVAHRTVSLFTLPATAQETDYYLAVGWTVALRRYQHPQAVIRAVRDNPGVGGAVGGLYFDLGPVTRRICFR
jgi:hypothetical protein